MWVVIVYDDVSGWDAHTVKGEYYNLFRHYGHNIVVGRIVEPYSTRYPWGLSQKFSSALRIHWKSECTDWTCWSRYSRVDARPTVDATWNNLYNEGITPIMLHVFRGNTDGAVAISGNGRLSVRRLADGGLATLLAVAS